MENVTQHHGTPQSHTTSQSHIFSPSLELWLIRSKVDPFHPQPRSDVLLLYYIILSYYSIDFSNKIKKLGCFSSRYLAIDSLGLSMNHQ